MICTNPKNCERCKDLLFVEVSEGSYEEEGKEIPINRVHNFADTNVKSNP